MARDMVSGTQECGSAGIDSLTNGAGGGGEDGNRCGWDGGSIDEDGCKREGRSWPGPETAATGRDAARALHQHEGIATLARTRQHNGLGTPFGRCDGSRGSVQQRDDHGTSSGWHNSGGDVVWPISRRWVVGQWWLAQRPVGSGRSCR